MIGDVSRGRALKQVVCLIDGQTLHANFTTRLLTCAHCDLKLELTAAEADELYMLEIWPGGGVLQPETWLPALYAAHHIHAVPAGQEPFLAINAELAPLWPVLARKKPALPDAGKWDGVPDKLPLLERFPAGPATD